MLVIVVLDVAVADLVLYCSLYCNSCTIVAAVFIYCGFSICPGIGSGVTHLLFHDI